MIGGMVESIGFSGTRYGMSEEQSSRVMRLIDWIVGDRYAVTKFSHGDAAGADEQMHTMMFARRRARTIHIFPPTDPRWRANCVQKHVPGGGLFDEFQIGSTAVIVAPQQDFLVRNRAIVDGSDILIAAPQQGGQRAPHSIVHCPCLQDAHLRGGTLWTIRYAIAQGKPTYIVHTNGTIIKVTERINLTSVTGPGTI